MKSPLAIGLAIALSLTGCASTTTPATSTPWPWAVSKLQPDDSQSAVKTAFPEMPVVPPASGVSPDKARWSGKWQGWACQRAACDTKLVVLSVTNEGAKVVPLFASGSTPYNLR